MKAGNSFDNNIIVRFLMQEASADDTQLLESWISSTPENRAYFEQIRDTWNSIELEKELDDQQIHNDLKNVLDRTSPTANDRRLPDYPDKKFPKNWFLKVAAVFILGFIASWLLFNRPASTLLEESTFNIITTPNGSSTSISLPDGSEIWLNAGSTLKYPQQFSKNKREVFLEGEAFFNVSKDKKRQFLVVTPDITVKVFGTSFNVKSYPDENTVETTLVEGSISIYNHSTNGKELGTEIKMEPNQRIVLYKEPENSTTTLSERKKIENVPARKPKLVLSKRIETERFTSWKDGELIFKSEPLEKLASTLERRYNVHIHFMDDGIRQSRFTGTIKKETIEQVMAAIKLASSIDYKIEEGEIWISKMGQ